MPFLHYELLALLPLAAIPVVLHLLTLHRVKTVELSTFRFLFDSYVQQRRKTKFMEALLAALRTLFLLLLVIALARPTLRHWGSLFGNGSGREVVMLVDCSASMNARTAGVSAMERAKTAAESVAKGLSRDDRLTLIRVAARPETLFSKFATDAEGIRDKIETLRAGPSRANLFASLMQVFDARPRNGAPPTVYLFTDRQSDSWREVRDQGLEKVLPPKVKFTVVNVGSSEPVGNRGVIGSAPRQRQAIVGLPVMLRPRVVNYSKTETIEVPVVLVLDEKEVARTSFTLKPGENATREIVYIPGEPGVMRGRYEIPPDRFPDDDSFLFTLPVVPRLNVVLANGNPVPDPYENEGLYLRTAMTAGDDSDPTNPAPAPVTEKGAKSTTASREFVKSLDLQEIPEGRLNPDAIKDAAVVILANCGGLNDQHFTWLREYVSGGGGLIVFPGDKVNPDQYNKSFFTAPGPQGERLISASLRPAEGDPEKPETFERLGTIDFSHPVLSIFEDKDAHYLSNTRFQKRFPIVLTESKGASWPLAKFSTGAPALVEGRFGEGVVLLAAFPANVKWTNLPLKPEFVPMVLRMVGHAKRAPELDVPSTVPPDGSAEIAVAGAWAPASGTVLDVHRRQTPIGFQRSSSRLIAPFEQTADKGYYAVDVRGGRSEQPKAGSAAFAVNLAPEESNLDAASDDQIRKFLPTADLTFVDATAQAIQAHGAIGEEHEVWRPLIMLMFFVIGAEFLLATTSGQRTDPNDDRTVGERLRDYSPGTWVGRMTGAGHETTTT